MSRLAHATYGAPGFGKDRRALLKDLDDARSLEIKNAKEIQKQTGCTWGEVLRAAISKVQGGAA